MKPSDDLQKRIEILIQDYCESEKEPIYLKALAEQNQVLPIYIDWTAFFGLRSNGDIVLVPTEDLEEARWEVDERWKRVAIFRGSKKYPELKPLVAEKPFGASDCPHCEGRGRIDIPGLEADPIVCYCGGLGWLTEEEIRAETRG